MNATGATCPPKTGRGPSSPAISDSEISRKLAFASKTLHNTRTGNSATSPSRHLAPCKWEISKSMSYIKRSRSLSCLLLAILFALVSNARGSERQRPNIVIILADDLGYGDVRCNNPERGRIPTPCIDRLASQGMRFTDAHSSSAVCSPTRYTLLTGRYHWRTRLQSWIVWPFGKPLIAPDRLTIAGLLKRNGYRTACVGKWHLGWDWPIPDDGKQLFFAKPKTPDAAPSEEQKALWRECLPPADCRRSDDTRFRPLFRHRRPELASVLFYRE